MVIFSVYLVLVGLIYFIDILDYRVKDWDKLDKIYVYLLGNRKW